MKVKIDIKSYSHKLLKKGILCHVFAALFLVSCSGKKVERNEVNIKLYTSMDKAVPVLLSVNNETLVREETKPFRGLYEQVKVSPRINESVVIFHKVGDRDTTFTYRRKNRRSYLSINYSRWWDKFFILDEDSAAFYSGGNDVIYHDED